MDQTSVIQFGYYRSGSTLIWNYLRLLFPDRNIIKVHDYFEACIKIPVVITVRNLDACIASYWRVYFQDYRPGETFTEDCTMTFEEYRSVYHKMRHFYYDTKKFKKHENVLELQYEMFYNDFGYIHQKMQDFFRIEIEDAKKAEIEEKLSIDSMKKIASKYSSFSEYDEQTHIHGGHIWTGESLVQKVIPNVGNYRNRLMLR